MGGKTGTTSGLALLLAVGMAWAGGVSGGEGNRGLSPIITIIIASIIALKVRPGGTAGNDDEWRAAA